MNKTALQCLAFMYSVTCCREDLIHDSNGNWTYQGIVLSVKQTNTLLSLKDQQLSWILMELCDTIQLDSALPPVFIPVPPTQGLCKVINEEKWQQEYQQRCDWIEEMGVFDGAHHKMYCIDQLLQQFLFDTEGEEYTKFTARYQLLHGYAWSKGTAP